MVKFSSPTTTTSYSVDRKTEKVRQVWETVGKKNRNSQGIHNFVTACGSVCSWKNTIIKKVRTNEGVINSISNVVTLDLLANKFKHLGKFRWDRAKVKLLSKSDLAVAVCISKQHYQIHVLLNLI